MILAPALAPALAPVKLIGNQDDLELAKFYRTNALKKLKAILQNCLHPFNSQDVLNFFEFEINNSLFWLNVEQGTAINLLGLYSFKKLEANENFYIRIPTKIYNSNYNKVHVLIANFKVDMIHQIPLIYQRQIADKIVKTNLEYYCEKGQIQNPSLIYNKHLPIMRAKTLESGSVTKGSICKYPLHQLLEEGWDNKLIESIVLSLYYHPHKNKVLGSAKIIECLPLLIEE